MTTSAERPYRLGRTERRGSVFGWRPGQAASVGIGASCLVLAAASGGASGAVLGIAALVAGVIVAVVPLAGRGLDEWAPVLVGHAVRVRGGALSPGATVQPEDEDAPAHLRWPDGARTVVVELRHRGMRALSDEPRALGESVASWLRGLGAACAPRWTVSLLSVSAPGPTVRGAPWIDPGMRVRSYVAVTATEAVRVAEVLAGASVPGAAPLCEGELTELLAARVSPAAGTLLGCDLAARWGLLVGPASAHAAFVFEEWPSGDVDEQVLAPLCLSADRRTVCLAVRIDELGRARSRTAAARTAAAADEAVASGGGFLSSPESSRDAARDAERAAELAAGHGSARIVGTIGIDADDPLALEAAAARLLADAASCGVRLRRCDGDHRRGVLASVPGWCLP